MKLSLIVPKHKGGGGTMFPFLPPLGLESIAVYIKNYFYFNDLEVEIFDENITPFSKIVDSLPRDGVVGISLWHSNAHRMNFFGRAAKEKNN
ncbi:hypothetical protein FJ208_01305, partial [Candidatus Gribaldobacteria bacterium]|nr:hypothetical protein [Candidatus Gribaldobacteria bacterium]